VHLPATRGRGEEEAATRGRSYFLDS
jgi:hypothetical protein